MIMVAGGTEGNKCGDFHFICNILSLKQIWSKKRFFVNFLLFVYFIFEIITVLSKYFKPFSLGMQCYCFQIIIYIWNRIHLDRIDFILNL